METINSTNLRFSIVETSSQTPFSQTAFTGHDFSVGNLPAKIKKDDVNIFGFQVYHNINTAYSVSSFLRFFKEKYSIVEENQIYDYLIKKPSLIDLVNQAVRQIERYFGAHIKDLILEVFYDPEDDKSSGELFLTIKNDLAIEKASEIFNKFVQKWFMSQVKENSIYFNVDLI